MQDHREWLERHEEHVAALSAQIDAAQRRAFHLDDELRQERLRLRRALDADAEPWDARPFLPPPAERPCPVIAVLSVGGAGATTVTANLAAALDRAGRRLLVLDLDARAALTDLLTDAPRLCLADVIAGSFEAGGPSLTDAAVPVFQRSALVPATDRLADAEAVLAMRWRLGEDVRGVLRRHVRRARFDAVLIDGPPRLDALGVNLLAACDAVLIPVTPGGPTLRRVPALLRRVRLLADAVNPGLEILGVVANGTAGQLLTLGEDERLASLAARCREAWGGPVPVRRTHIERSESVARAAEQRRVLWPGDGLFSAFAELATEVDPPANPAQFGSGR